MRQRGFPLMIFAAGFGTRMGALTAQRPKPLIPVGGVALLDRALALARTAGAAPIVVNTHYLGEQIEAHLAGQEVAISPEPDQILETGGGLRQALPQLGPGPVMTLNPDVLWVGPNPLLALAQAWDPARMDALLLTKPVKAVKGRGARSDFVTDAQGRLQRAGEAEGVIYLGAQILNPAGLTEVSERAFSLNILWDRMIAKGRAYALPYPGQWCDVGSPAGLAEAESLLATAGATAP